MHVNLVRVICVSVLLQISVFCLSDALTCCPQGSNLTESGKCLDGSKVKLKCQQFYLLDPLEDKSSDFYIDDESRMVFKDGSGSLPSNSYCLMNLSQKSLTALVCFSDVEEKPQWRFTVLGIAMSISTFFLVLTLIVYSMLPQLRDIQDKTMMCMMTALTMGYLTLTMLLLIPAITEVRTLCVSFGFIMYFCFMTMFFWLNLIAFNVWRLVWFDRFPLSDNSLFVVFAAIGFVGPSSFLIYALLTHHMEGAHLKPGFGDTHCWFAGRRETWTFFYAPMTILLTLNVIYLVLTSRRLSKICNNKEVSDCKIKATRYKCSMFIKLMLVMGIPWVCEFLSYLHGPENSFLWIPTDILNSLQGLIIFVLLVLTRKKVKSLLAKSKVFGVYFPKSWIVHENDEDCDTELPEELELTNNK